MLKRTLILGGIGFVALAGPASAQAYVNDVTITRETVSAQCYVGTVTFQFAEGGTVTATASNGTATAAVPANEDDDGQIEVSVSGTGCNGQPNNQAEVLGVTVTQGTGGTSLPRTGDESSLPLAQAGAALVAVGGATVYGVRRRHRATA